jgi:hypothetical protein
MKHFQISKRQYIYKCELIEFDLYFFLKKYIEPKKKSKSKKKSKKVIREYEDNK